MLNLFHREHLEELHCQNENNLHKRHEIEFPEWFSEKISELKSLHSLICIVYILLANLITNYITRTVFAITRT